MSQGREAVVTYSPLVQTPVLEKPRGDTVCRENYERLPV